MNSNDDVSQKSGSTHRMSDLEGELRTMLDRWQSDAETLDQVGMDRKGEQLKQCIADVRHILNKHADNSSDDQ